MKKTNVGINFLVALLIFVWCTGTGMLFAYDKTYTAYMAGNAHIDTAWRWPLIDSAIECNTTFTNACNLMNSNSDYRFSGSASQHYKWVKEYYPSLYNTIKSKYTAGQWEIVGGQVVEPDLNVPSGESLVRQSLYAQKFFQSEFGAKCTIGWVPDVFGFTGAMPQILKKSGMDYFVTTKLNWNDTNTFPYEIFKWQGIDGTQVVSYKPLRDYVNIYSDSDINTSLNKPNALGIKKSLCLYGSGDHGGGPNQSNITQIRNQDANSSLPHVHMQKASDFFNSLTTTEKNALPVWDGEMYLENHRGTFTTWAATKKYNRTCENTAEEAEKFSSIADWLGAAKYPMEKITKSWDKMLTDQFHDILPGSSILQVYKDMWDDSELALNHLNSSMTNAFAGIMNRADTSGNGVPVVVFNPLSFNRRNPVEVDVTFPAPPSAVRVYDSANIEVPSQVKSITGNTAKVVFVADGVPSLGFRVFRAESTTAGSYSTGLTIGSNAIENQYFRIEINPSTGNISRIYDKTNAREALSGGEANVLQVYENDTPTSYDAWNMDKDDFATTVTPVSLTTPASITVVESGPVKATYKVSRLYNNSAFNQYITLYHNVDRIDLRLEAGWWESHRCLKVAFPFNASPTTATYEIAYGAVTRSTSRTSSFDAARFEVPGHKWADLSYNGYGVSLLNDSKYGWDALNNRLRITLLRSPTTPILNGADSGGPTADMGNHVINYSVYPHSGDWKSANTPYKGYELNYPLVPVTTTAHTGSLGKTFSFASVNQPNIVISALKKIEDSASNDLIIRMYETQGQASTSATITLAGNINSISETNLLEENTGTPSYSANQFSTTFGKFEIKTFRVSMASPNYSNTQPTITKVNLNSYFNIDAISSDSNRADGCLDFGGYSYPAEQIPAEIVSEGIKFDTGSKTDGAMNAITCAGQTVNWTAGQFNRVYVLATAVHASCPEAGTFTVRYSDSSTSPVDIPVHDWCATMGGWGITPIPETIAFYVTHRHNINNTDDMVKDTYLYLYPIAIDSSKSVSGITLPNNDKIKVFAISLASGPAFPPMPVYGPVNVALNKGATADGNATNEEPSKAVDGSICNNFKWCVTGVEPHWLRLDLGQSYNVNQFVVKHAEASGEKSSYNTRDFKIQTSSDGTNWTDRVTVTANTAAVTTHNISSVSTRYVRLYITKATQTTDTAARIPEFEVYGTLPNRTTVFSSGFESGDTLPTWSDTIDGSLNVSGYNAGINPECSTRSGGTEKVHAGTTAIMYSGTDNSTTSSYCYYKVFDVNLLITPTTRLSYWFYPQQANGRFVAIDFICTDGTTLRDSAAVDFNGVKMHPNAGRGQINTWTPIRCDIGQWLNGKTIDRILIGYDQPGSTGQYRGYIDDILITQ
jgi:alpha-mannosidase